MEKNEKVRIIAIVYVVISLGIIGYYEFFMYPDFENRLISKDNQIADWELQYWKVQRYIYPFDETDNVTLFYMYDEPLLNGFNSSFPSYLYVNHIIPDLHCGCNATSYRFTFKPSSYLIEEVEAWK